MNETSIWAHESVAKFKGETKHKIFYAILESRFQGMTCDELEVNLGIKIQSITPRVREMSMDGWILDVGKRRPTRSGRMAVCWVHPDFAPCNQGEGEI